MSIDTVDLRFAVLAFLIMLLPWAGFALIIAARLRSDDRAARPIRQQQLPAALPVNFHGGHDRLDERGRPW